MRASLGSAIGALAIVAAGAATPAVADDLRSAVRTLNAILNPQDAQRLEDEARRNRRVEEERYWHDYRLGLEQQQRRGPGSAYGERQPGRIGPDEARRLEEQARRDGRRADERYWRDYRLGLEEQQRPGPGPGYGERQPGRIGLDEARRLEEQARRSGRRAEEQYWHDYAAGLEGGRRGGPGYREENRSAVRIGPGEARQLEEQARRNGRWAEAQYWEAYRLGLEGRR